MKKYLFLALVSSLGLCHSQEAEDPAKMDKERDWSNAKADHTSHPETKSTASNNANDAEHLPEKKNGNENEKKEEEKPKSPHTFSGNVSLVTDYRFRGISQTMRRPAIQGGFDYAHTCGIYLGTWASNVDGTTHFYNNTCMEWDFYGGFKGKLFPCIPDLGYNLGFIYYFYPGGKAQNHHNTRYNTAEFYLELFYHWISVKYSQTISNYFGINSDNTPFNWDHNRADRSNGSSCGSYYIEADLTFDLMDKVCFSCLEAGKLNLLLHVGHQTVRHYSHLNNLDWKATLTQEFAWFHAFVSYVGTNANHDYFDVPDNAFHPRKHGLGVQGVVFGIIRLF